MKFILCFLFIITAIFPYSSVYSQDESELLKDLLLSDEEIKNKYLKDIKNPDILIKDYNTTTNIQDRISIAYKLCDFLKTDSAFNHLIKILMENRFINGQKEVNWKLKSIVIYQLGMKGANLSDLKRLRIQEVALEKFKTSNNPRIIAASALTLSRLSPNKPTDRTSHRLFNQRTVSYALVEKMLTLNKKDHYLSWVLCKASLINEDPYTLTAIRELKKLPLVPYVKREIRKTISELKKNKKE